MIKVYSALIPGNGRLPLTCKRKKRIGAGCFLRIATFATRFFGCNSGFMGTHACFSSSHFVAYRGGRVPLQPCSSLAPDTVGLKIVISRLIKGATFLISILTTFGCDRGY